MRRQVRLLSLLPKCKVMAEATLSKENQIVLPKETREALGIKPGDRLMVVTRGATVILMPKPASYAAALLGLGRGMYGKDHVRKERASWRK